MEIVRLHLGRLEAFKNIPVHGFVIKHPRAGAILVDTGVGSASEDLIQEFRIVNRHMADALAEHDLSPADVVRVIATPGHTIGHQSVVVDLPDGASVMIGDAAYTADIYREADRADLSEWPGQASDRADWARSLERVQAMQPRVVHFCHDTAVIHT